MSQGIAGFSTPLRMNLRFSKQMLRFWRADKDQSPNLATLLAKTECVLRAV